MLRAACRQPGPSSKPNRAIRIAWRANCQRRGQVATFADRCGDEAANAGAVLQSGRRSLAHSGQLSVGGVAHDDNPPGGIAGAPAWQVPDVVAHQLGGIGGGHDRLDPR